MTVGFLVNPDLTRRKLEFELEDANQFLGGTTEIASPLFSKKMAPPTPRSTTPKPRPRAPSLTR